MKLSTNLTLAEVVKSQQAVRQGILNLPDDTHLKNLKALALRVFQPIRDHFNVPIAVTSGYRSSELNKAIGGSRTSQHSKGEALDLDADVFGGLKNSEIFYFISENLVFDQMIWEYGNKNEPAWVHVSLISDGSRANRNQKLRCFRKGGRTRYIPFDL